MDINRMQELIRYKTDYSIGTVDKLVLRDTKILDLYDGWTIDEVTCNDIYRGSLKDFTRIELVLVKVKKEDSKKPSKLKQMILSTIKRGQTNEQKND